MTARTERLQWRRALWLALLLLLGAPTSLLAHERGRPVPLARQQTLGPYRVSVWSSTDVGAGEVHVVLHEQRGVPLQLPTAVRLVVRSAADPGDVTTYFPSRQPVGHGARFRTPVYFGRDGAWQLQLMLDGAGTTRVLPLPLEVTVPGTVGAAGVLLYAAPFLLVAGWWIRSARARRPRARAVFATASSPLTP